MELLERLPQAILAPRRRRQIAEMRKRKRRPIARERGGSMATFVGSPMSETAMEKAADDDIFRMLDEIHDASERSHRRPISRDGGVVELSRAFAEFGKKNPEGVTLVEPDSKIANALAAMLDDGVSSQLTGRLFSAAAAWRESESSLRRRAHAFLMEYVSRSERDQAHAISSAVDKRDTLAPDDFTRELIVAVAEPLRSCCVSYRQVCGRSPVSAALSRLR